MPYCSNCGKDISEGFDSCPHCGKQIVDGVSKKSTPENKEEITITYEPFTLKASIFKPTRTFGYILLIVSVFSGMFKEVFIWMISSGLLILGTFSYLLIGTLYLKDFKRFEARRFFRPYIIGSAIAIGFFCLMLVMKITT